MMKNSSVERFKKLVVTDDSVNPLMFPLSQRRSVSGFDEFMGGEKRDNPYLYGRPIDAETLKKQFEALHIYKPFSNDLYKNAGAFKSLLTPILRTLYFYGIKPLSADEFLDVAIFLSFSAKEMLAWIYGDENLQKDLEETKSALSDSEESSGLYKLLMRSKSEIDTLHQKEEDLTKELEEAEKDYREKIAAYIKSSKEKGIIGLNGGNLKKEGRVYQNMSQFSGKGKSQEKGEMAQKKKEAIEYWVENFKEPFEKRKAEIEKEIKEIQLAYSYVKKQITTMVEPHESNNNTESFSDSGSDTESSTTDDDEVSSPIGFHEVSPYVDQQLRVYKVKEPKKFKAYTLIDKAHELLKKPLEEKLEKGKDFQIALNEKNLEIRLKNTLEKVKSSSQSTEGLKKAREFYDQRTKEIKEETKTLKKNISDSDILNFFEKIQVYEYSREVHWAHESLVEVLESVLDDFSRNIWWEYGELNKTYKEQPSKELAEKIGQLSDMLMFLGIHGHANSIRYLVWEGEIGDVKTFFAKSAIAFSTVEKKSTDVEHFWHIRRAVYFGHLDGILENLKDIERVEDGPMGAWEAFSHHRFQNHIRNFLLTLLGENRGFDENSKVNTYIPFSNSDPKHDEHLQLMNHFILTVRRHFPDFLEDDALRFLAWQVIIAQAYETFIKTEDLLDQNLQNKFEEYQKVAEQSERLESELKRRKNAQNTNQKTSLDDRKKDAKALIKKLEEQYAQLSKACLENDPLSESDLYFNPISSLSGLDSTTDKCLEGYQPFSPFSLYRDIAQKYTGFKAFYEKNKKIEGASIVNFQNILDAKEELMQVSQMQFDLSKFNQFQRKFQAYWEGKEHHAPDLFIQDFENLHRALFDKNVLAYLNQVISNKKQKVGLVLDGDDSKSHEKVAKTLSVAPSETIERYGFPSYQFEENSLTFNNPYEFLLSSEQFLRLLNFRSKDSEENELFQKFKAGYGRLIAYYEYYAICKFYTYYQDVFEKKNPETLLKSSEGVLDSYLQIITMVLYLVENLQQEIDDEKLLQSMGDDANKFSESKDKLALAVWKDPKVKNNYQEKKKSRRFGFFGSRKNDKNQGALMQSAFEDLEGLSKTRQYLAELMTYGFNEIFKTDNIDHPLAIWFDPREGMTPHLGMSQFMGSRGRESFNQFQNNIQSVFGLDNGLNSTGRASLLLMSAQFKQMGLEGWSNLFAKSGDGWKIDYSGENVVLSANVQTFKALTDMLGGNENEAVKCLNYIGHEAPRTLMNDGKDNPPLLLTDQTGPVMDSNDPFWGGDDAFDMSEVVYGDEIDDELTNKPKSGF